MYDIVLLKYSIIAPKIMPDRKPLLSPYYGTKLYINLALLLGVLYIGLSFTTATVCRQAAAFGLGSAVSAIMIKIFNNIIARKYGKLLPMIARPQPVYDPDGKDLKAYGLRKVNPALGFAYAVVTGCVGIAVGGCLALYILT